MYLSLALDSFKMSTKGIRNDFALLKCVMFKAGISQKHCMDNSFLYEQV